jgi:hypothetical protein
VALSARFGRLLTPDNSPARENGAVLQQSLDSSAVESSAGSFLSARSDSLSEASSWVSGEVLPRASSGKWLFASASSISDQ